MSIEHIIRSFSFILLVYGAIETFVSFLEGKQKGTLAVGIGLGMWHLENLCLVFIGVSRNNSLFSFNFIENIWINFIVFTNFKITTKKNKN